MSAPVLGTKSDDDVLTLLECGPDRVLDILGVRAYDQDEEPAPPGAEDCEPLVRTFSHLVQKCTNERSCVLARRELYVNPDQCPGVASVLYDVNCRVEGAPRPQLSLLYLITN